MSETIRALVLFCKDFCYSEYNITSLKDTVFFNFVSWVIWKNKDNEFYYVVNLWERVV